VQRGDVQRAARLSALRFRHGLLDIFAGRLAEAEFTAQADEVIKNVVIDNFAQRSTSSAARSSTSKRADDCACYATENDAGRPGNHSGQRAKLCAACDAGRTANSTSNRASSTDRSSCMAFGHYAA
jgi:hypothetical protein